MEDYVILVDEHQHVLGTAPKLASHNGDTPLHLAFSVFLFNSKGALLLQQRSHKKKTWPLMWSNSCCGHQKLNQTIEETAQQRVLFELGIHVSHLSIMLPNFRYRCEKDGIVENEICPVLVGSTDQTPRPNAEEVEQTRWISWNEWTANLSEKEYSYWSVKETEELVKSSDFQDFLHRAIK